MALQAKPTSIRHTRDSSLFCSNFLVRLLFIALSLSLLPLFTSEPPDFISNSVFAETWELLHLLLIGIIVSYGLFGRRGTMEIQNPSSPTSMLHGCTIFNFDHPNPCAYSVHGNANVTRPFGLEPTVIVRPGTHDISYKPLDLPVRSLRSRVEESDSEICATESEIEADTCSSCCCYEEDDESQNLDPWNWPTESMDAGDVNFGTDFHQVKHVKKGSSPLRPCESEKNNSRENVEFGSSRFIQAGTKCEVVVRRSATAEAGYLERESKEQDSPKSESLLESRSALSESPPPTEGMGKMSEDHPIPLCFDQANGFPLKSSRDSSLSTTGSESLSESPSPTEIPLDLEKKAIGRRFSIGSVFDRQVRKGSKDARKENKKCGWDCLKLDTVTKRGKSVRTVRPQAITLDPSCGTPKKESRDVVIISIGVSGNKNTGGKGKQEKAEESASVELGNNISAVPVDDDEDCNSEIDRKAGEFIAKFKHQIRLQKLAYH